jgi:hypothetical protein
VIPGHWQETVYTVDNGPTELCFDGANIWVICKTANSLRRIRLADGAVLPAITAGVNGPEDLAFDGAYIHVTNYNGNSISSYKTDGTLADSYPVVTTPKGITFDGQSLWVANHNLGTVSIH